MRYIRCNFLISTGHPLVFIFTPLLREGHETHQAMYVSRDRITEFAIRETKKSHDEFALLMAITG